MRSLIYFCHQSHKLSVPSITQKKGSSPSTLLVSGLFCNSACELLAEFEWSAHPDCLVHFERTLCCKGLLLEALSKKIFCKYFVEILTEMSSGRPFGTSTALSFTCTLPLVTNWITEELSCVWREDDLPSLFVS